MTACKIHSPTPAISFEDVSKLYGQVRAVDHLTLELNGGELFGFLGPNGAGKTTAMKIAAGLVKPTSGRVLISGCDIQTQPLEAKKLFGYVPDSPYIYESLTGREFLHFCAGMYRMDGTSVKSRIEKIGDRLNIGAWIDKRTGEYSHGMKQRIVMASAFLHEPKIIIIDEPMVGLDPAGVRIVKGIMKEFCAGGGTVFFSTHTLPDAEEMCNRVGIIHEGRLIACGALEEVRGSYSRLEESYFAVTSGEVSR